MKKLIIAVSISLAAVSVNAATSMTLQEKADAIQQVRADANAAMNINNIARAHGAKTNWSDPADGKAVRTALAVLNGTQAKLDAIANAPLAPTAIPQAPMKTPPLAPTKTPQAVPQPIQQTPPAPTVNVPQITGTTYRAYVAQLQAAALAAPSQQPKSVPMTALTPSTPVQTGFINQPAGKLPVNTLVQTPIGVIPAGQLPPTVQVAVPYIPAIINHSGNSGNRDHSHNHSAQSTDNNGQANAHASAFGGGRNADGAHFH